MAAWWQLVYTSADFKDGTPGGWGVKFAVPPEARAMGEAVLTGVDIRTFMSEDLGNFPTAEILSRRSRQLTSRSVADGTVLLHMVSAGADATGRPGNVYLHGALARDGEPERLGIEYWRSPDWLVPFGPKAVSTARLPNTLRPGSAISREATANFLARPGSLSVLAVLLECLCSPDRSDAPAVLVVDSDDEAAQWIAALSYIRDARNDADLTWTTWTRVESLTTLHSLGVRLLAVSRTEYDAARVWAQETPEARLIDGAGSYILTDSGVWCDASGIESVRAEWASDLMVALGPPVAEFGSDVLVDLLGDVAEMCAESSADHEDPLWAIAAAELADPDLEILDRRELTLAVLVFGPKETRPAAVTAAIDSWWLEDAASARGELGESDVSEILLTRRLVLLLAGELTWDSAIDGQFELSAFSRDAISTEVGNAEKRLEALLEISTRHDEAAAILRALEAYGAGPGSERAAAMRGRLGAGLSPAEREQLLAASQAPLRSTRLAQQVTAQRSAAVEPPAVLVADPPAPQETVPSVPGQRPAVYAQQPEVRRTTGPAPADLFGPTSVVGGTEPLPPPIPPVTMKSASPGLSQRWVSLMYMAVNKHKVPAADVAEIRERVKEIKSEDVATELLRYEDPVLFVLLTKALEVSMDQGNVNSPFAIGRVESRLTSALLYDVAVRVLRQVQAPGAPERAWSVVQWEDAIAKHEARAKGKKPTSQAWGVARDSMGSWERNA